MIKTWHTIATVAVVCGSTSTVCAATSPSLDQLNPQYKVLTIAEHEGANTASFLVSRCRGLVTAAAMHRQIMRSNPVTGKQEHLGASFDWAADRDVLENLDAAEANIGASDYSQVDYYMKAFGTIEFPSRVPEHPLYIADKATCLERFGKR